MPNKVGYNQKEWFAFDALKVDERCFVVCAGCHVCANIMCGLAVLVMVCIICVPMSGAKYFTSDIEGGFAPTCNMIFHPLLKNGTKVDLGTWGGGGDIFDTNVSFRLMTNASWSSFVTPDCAVAVMDSHPMDLQSEMKPADDKPPPEKYSYVVDLQIKKPFHVPMQSGCGDDGWVQADSGGLWVTPFIIGAVQWFFLRVLATIIKCGVAFVNAGAIPPGSADECPAKPLGNVFSQLCMWMSWACLAPVMNFEVSESCPQVVFTFYSTTVQMSLSIGSLFGLCLFGGCYCCCGNAALPCLCLGITTWCTSTLVYFGFFVISISWTWFFAFRFNLSLSWPEFSFAFTVHLFHILSFLLWLLDVASLIAFACRTLRQLNKKQKDAGAKPSV